MVKFLVIRFSSIGDIVLTTPVLKSLRDEIEGAEIHYLTKPAYLQILEHNPRIDRIHLLQDSLTETIKLLAEESFDYVIDLQNSLRSMQIRRALKRMYFSVNKLNTQKWLFVNFKIDLLPEKHIVDRYLATLKAFSCEKQSAGLEYYLGKKDIVDIENAFGIMKKDYIVIVIGAQHSTKKLPPESIASLCDLLSQPVILVGGPEDKENADHILELTSNESVYSACGDFRINQSASIVEQASCIITHDTGMMHIAAAFGKKILSIWGNTTPKFGMYPYQPHPESKIFEVANLRCRPCSKLGKKKCPKDHFRCMLDQDLKKIALHANSLARTN